MTRLERAIYDLLKSNPQLKLMVRNIYQSLFDLLPRQKELLPDGSRTFPNCFLGFHDIQPFSADNRLLLAHRTTQPLTLPRNGEQLEVGYITLDNGEFCKVSSTSAWNFHKGARLQWFSDTKIVYNDSKGSIPISVIRDITTSDTITLPAPIDTLSPDARYATSFSYERLERLMPGYGYLGINDDRDDDHTGLFLIDIGESGRFSDPLASRKPQLLISISELKSEAGEQYSDYGHFVTHTEFSRDGRYISFLHRYVPADDISRRVTRLGIYDRETGNHFFLPPLTMVSHYVWNTRSEILAYCGLDGIDSHVLFKIVNGKCISYMHIAEDRLNSDGHQTFAADDLFITDTYPDRRRMAKLYQVNTSNGNAQLLASIYSPKSYQTHDQRNHIACDLHPRASADGSWLCIDTPRTGVRSLCVMPISLNDTKISVIIPSYKPGDYIWKCLSSVAEQTLAKSQFEVILVLNGPTEPYKTEIQRYIDDNLKDLNIRLIVTETPGVGNARNIGLDSARGEYIAFIDDDDYISPSYLEELLEHAAPDTISLSNTIAFSDSNPHIPFRIEREYLRCHEAGRQPFIRPKKYISGPCMKLIPAAIIGNRRFDTRLRNGEDTLFSFTISDRMRYADFTSPDAIYYRRVRSSGAQFSVTRWQQFCNALRLTLRYTSIYIKSPRRYSLRFYLSRILGCIHVVITGPKGI